MPSTSSAVPSPPSVEEHYDIGDAIIHSSMPTMPLVELEIGENGRARLDLPRCEMGQGITTALAMMVAEELDLAMADVDVTLADARPELMFNQMTAGSTTVRAFYEPVRVLAATARAQLVAAAAEDWGLEPQRLSTRDGQVIAPDGRTATYGSLSATAATLSLATAPAHAPPKPASEHRIIGTPQRRVDGRDIVTGQKKFTTDLPVPGAMPTMVRRPPSIQGTVRSIHNADEVKAMPGVAGVVQIPTGVAVVADTFEQARAGVNALDVTFGPGPVDKESNERMLEKLRTAVPPFTTPPVDDGVVKAGTTLEAEFDWAPLYHAFLETETAIADVRADSAEIWSGFQTPIYAQQAVADMLGLPQDRVQAHVVPPGGAFGRRVHIDGALEAAQISKALGRPIKLMWARVNDVRHGRVRPPEVSRFRVNVVGGKIVSFEQRVASLEVDFRHGLGEALTAAATQLPEKERQAVGNQLFGQAVFATMVSSPYHFGAYTKLKDEVQLGTWTASYRSVPCQPARVPEEIMVDEVAAHLGKDPVELRREVLKSDRARAVLDKAAAVGEWGRSLPAGFGQGVGVHSESRTYTAAVVEVDARDPKSPRVTRATIVVDIGFAINPLGLKAQMEGCLVDAIAVTLTAGLHIKDGLPLESSFGDYRFAKMRDVPRDVEVIVMPPNGEEMGGAGEIGFAAPSAAIANAYAKATGIAPRSFPINFPVDFDPVPRGLIPPPVYS